MWSLPVNFKREENVIRFSARISGEF